MRHFGIALCSLGQNICQLFCAAWEPDSFGTAGAIYWIKMASACYDNTWQIWGLIFTESYQSVSAMSDWCCRMCKPKTLSFTLSDLRAKAVGRATAMFSAANIPCCPQPSLEFIILDWRSGEISSLKELSSHCPGKQWDHHSWRNLKGMEIWLLGRCLVEDLAVLC